MTQRFRARAIVGLLALAAVGGAGAQTTTSTSGAAKKELVQRILRVQQGDIESMARNLVERPAAQMMREAGLAMQQQQLPQEKFQSTGKLIETEVKKYVEEAYPIVRERAIRIAPMTLGAALETKLSEDELKQVIAWMESPAAKKFQQVTSETQRAFFEQLSREAGPLVDPKLMALDGRIRVILGVPAAGSAPGSVATPAKPLGK
jgi:hypothetical protein